jgi:hypothetical protein
MLQRFITWLDNFLQRAAGVLMMLLGGGCALHGGIHPAASRWLFGGFAFVLLATGFIHTFTKR